MFLEESSDRPVVARLFMQSRKEGPRMAGRHSTTLSVAVSAKPSQERLFVRARKLVERVCVLAGDSAFVR